MMILVGIARESGLFEAIAIWLVKKVKGNPFKLLIVIGYLTLFMTMFLSNIPTVLILTPVVIVLIRELKLPHFPFIFILIAMANVGGAATPISDPTTYYQAKAVGLGFLEVVTNSGPIVLVTSVITVLFTLLVFRKQLQAVTINPEDVNSFDPKSALQNKKVLVIGTPILIISIILMISKEFIAQKTGIHLDNATIALGGAFLSMLLFHKEPHKIFTEIIDWDILFFFMGLFVVVGALEYTQVIDTIAQQILIITKGNLPILTFIITVGSSILSVFIDNVPYNITMVGAIQAMQAAGTYVYPLWWGLNLGTSIGGAGSPIGAACNVITLGQVEREKIHITFGKYLLFALPLIILNSFAAFVIIYFRYL